jgi:hypothetical protein
MFTVTVWALWAIYMLLGIVTGLIVVGTPMRWQDRLVWFGASVVAFVTAMVWADHFSL